MKTIKIITLLTAIFLFTSIPNGVEAAKDCSHEKELLDAGFVKLKFHHRHGYSWTVVGEKI